MWLRQGDSAKALKGKVIWIIGRRDSGKTTLIDALRKMRPDLIAIDDFLRCRAGITGKGPRAYNQMIGLGYALAFQGFDCVIACGCRHRSIRDQIRSEIPSSIFIYIDDRGRPCADYEQPEADEDILILSPALNVEEEAQICLKKLWPTI